MSSDPTSVAPDPPGKGPADEPQPRSLSEIRSLRPRQRRPVVIWVAAAAAGLLVGGGLLSTYVAPRPVPQPPASAQSLRQQAFDACRASRWGACLHLFDLARPLDPPGDADPAVQAARAMATSGLASQSK
jgi:hypothetical protein